MIQANGMAAFELKFFAKIVLAERCLAISGTAAIVSDRQGRLP